MFPLSTKTYLIPLRPPSPQRLFCPFTDSYKIFEKMKVHAEKALFLTYLLMLALADEVKSINCPPGTTLKPKFDSLPVPNGCGSTDTQTTLDKLLDPFTDYLSICCNYHDVCFQSCDFDGYAQRTFRQCNQQFNTCLTSQCDKVDYSQKPLCNIFAGAYTIAVDTLGGSAFNDDQRAACTCVLDLDKVFPPKSSNLLDKLIPSPKSNSLFDKILPPAKSNNPLDRLLPPIKSNNPFSRHRLQEGPPSFPSPSLFGRPEPPAPSLTSLLPEPHMGPILGGDRKGLGPGGLTDSLKLGLL